MKNIKLLVALLYSTICLGQIDANTQLPNVLPMSPESSEFIRYGDVPVNNYTGIPQVNIPIYTLKANGINIPISLSYNVNGIKVNQEATWVGLGWHLSADMEIVQSVVGLDDFGYYAYRQYPDFDCLISKQSSGLTATSVMSQENSFYLGFDDRWNIENPDCLFNPVNYAGTKDTQPDIFYFNVLGYGGKFMLDWTTETFVCLTDKRIKIQAPNYSFPNKPNNFTIIVPEGHKFEFDLKDEVAVNRSLSVNSFGGAAGSSIDMVNRNEKTSRVFKLSKIITNKGGFVDFEYTTSLVSKNLPTINLISRSYDPKEGAGSTYIPDNTGITTSYFATEQTFSYLSAIKYEDTQINFLTSSRIDLKEAKKLDKIEVKYKDVVVDSFDFDYSYFEGHTIGNNWDNFLNYDNYVVGKTNEELTHRLKLNSFKRTGINPYIFDYDQTVLPKKTSYATDYWGFYNGIHTNDSFFPNIYRFNVERHDPLYLDYQNNNKSADINYTKAATLLKVTYPTKGATIYNYELNSFSNFDAPSKEQGEAKNFSITTGTGSGPNPNEVILVKGGSTIFNGNALLSTRGCNFADLYDDTYIEIFHFKPSLTALIENTSYNYLYELAALGLIKGSSNFNQANYDTYINEVKSVRMRYDDPEELLISDLQFIFPEGVVYFTVKGGCGTYNGTVNSSQVTLSLSYRDYLPLANESYGAGLRVQAITDYTDGENPFQAANKKVFDYTNGKLMSPLIFYSKAETSFEVPMLVGYQGAGCTPPSDYLDKQSAYLYAYKEFVKNPSLKNAESLRLALYQLDNTTLNAGANCSPIYQINSFIGNKRELTSGSFVQPSLNANGNYVGYSEIIERRVDVNGNDNGKVVFEFINNQDDGVPQDNEGNSYFQEINLPFTKKYPENGLLLKTSILNKNSDTIQKVVYTYNSSMEEALWGVKTIHTDTRAFYTSTTGPVIEQSYLTGVYPIRSGVSLLEKEETFNFDLDNKIETKVEYTYDDYNQNKTTKVTYSGNNIREVRNKYPYDFQNSSVLSGMISNNILTPVIEEEILKNNERLTLQKNNFKLVSGENNYPMYLPESVENAKGSHALEQRILFSTYDSKGNLTQVSKKDGSKIYYVWGYNKEYPIAKIEGYNNSITSFQQTAIDDAITSSNFDKSDTTENTLRTKLESLRNAFGIQAMVTTYTYNPLIGVTSITDTRGETVFYEYDSLNRLLYIKDAQGNILKENKYNYKN
ncbi:YD repeat-containing protein [Tenacibaculum skagerrakense]|uniref:YD repeat-containing protein n=1 Tax=Tenacibaculum skagerrakense TaxID=186571 RepID=A0A4R2NRV5_9FLAO|nr:RHS repeat domain-containing protein [Tenacibaculum skagerrakense]TCP24241.1 YD repeat-containing protein [Tenacibaculum skagerrakense]